jgi:hypothetical protein
VSRCGYCFEALADTLCSMFLQLSGGHRMNDAVFYWLFGEVKGNIETRASCIKVSLLVSGYALRTPGKAVCTGLLWRPVGRPVPRGCCLPAASTEGAALDDTEPQVVGLDLNLTWPQSTRDFGFLDHRHQPEPTEPSLRPQYWLPICWLAQSLRESYDGCHSYRTCPSLSQ